MATKKKIQTTSIVEQIKELETGDPLTNYVQATLIKRHSEGIQDILRADAISEYLTRRNSLEVSITVLGHRVTFVDGTSYTDVHGTLKAIAAKMGLEDTPDGPSGWEKALTMIAAAHGIKPEITDKADFLRVV